ncbi:uncharacterized protein LOC127858723 [Dreissena polymorpha]|uniref:uncharacterized protein LOC127858723 n=1 Tax=Dreissena polymorpha TaxID=45954 RepID=UPI0022654CA8|nr:uncharacterized protein LOC127858723 [Dreissena polymorpha]
MELCKKLCRDLDGYSDRLTSIQKRIKIKEDYAIQKHDSLLNKFEAAIRRVQDEIPITVYNLKEHISSALRTAIENVPVIVTKFEHPTPINITATGGYTKELSLYLVEQITLHIRQSCEGNIKAKLSLVLDKMKGLLVTYGPVRHREYGQHAFNFQIKWDLMAIRQLNNIQLDVPAFANVSQWLQHGQYAFVFRNQVISVLGMGAYAGGMLLEKKLVSDLKDKYIANAINVLASNTTYYSQDISSQIIQNLGKELTIIKDQCYEALHKSRILELIDTADLMRHVNVGKQNIGFLSKNIHSLQGRVELHLVPIRVTPLNQLESAAIRNGRMEVVTQQFLLAAFCLGLVTVLLYYMWYR